MMAVDKNLIELAVRRSAEIKAQGLKPCRRCSGSGHYGYHGKCFRCGGNGIDPKAKSGVKG